MISKYAFDKRGTSPLEFTVFLSRIKPVGDTPILSQDDEK